MVLTSDMATKHDVHLNVISLFAALPCLQGVGRVPKHDAGRLDPDLRVLVNIVGVLGVWHRAPGRGNQDGDLVKLGPALAGGVQSRTALSDPLLDTFYCRLAVSF